MKAKIGNIEIEGTPQEIQEFIINSPQSRGDDGSLVTSKASISCEEPSCKPKTLVDTNNKEEYYGHKKEVMKDYDNRKM